MSTTPSTPVAASPNWITLLLTLGANLGASFIKNTQVGQLISLSATTASTIINDIQAARAASASTGTSLASNLVVPIFVGVLMDALSGAVIAGKITPSEATELNKALTAIATEDATAKAAVDYTTIGTIAPLP